MKRTTPLPAAPAPPPAMPTWEPLLDQVQLPFISAIHYRCDAQWRSLPRTMPDEQMHLIHCGQVDYTIGGVVHHGRAGQVAFLPPGVEWSAARASRRLVNLTVIHFQARFPGGQRYLDALGFAPVLRPTRAIWSRLTAVAAELCRLHAHKPDGCALRQAALIHDFFHAFYPLRGKSLPVDRDGRRVLAVIDFLRQRLAQRITLEDLGRAAHVSPNHLATLFRRYTGQSPIDYLIHLRLTEACRLLQSPDLPIRQVAATVGYDDAAYFSRIFRDHIGLSPRAYRREGLWT